MRHQFDSGTTQLQVEMNIGMWDQPEATPAWYNVPKSKMF